MKQIKQKSWDVRRKKYNTIQLVQNFTIQYQWLRVVVKSTQINQNICKIIQEIGLQQFNIFQCQDTDIFILLPTANVIIQQCKYCRIYIGPSESSVFVRNCYKCNFIVTCKQLRISRCIRCKFSSLCESQTALQKSWQIGFSCMDCDFNYKQYIGQLKKANIQVWNNNWWNINDYTELNTPNFYYFKAQEDKDFKNFKFKQLQFYNVELSEQIIPLTVGTSQQIKKQILMILFSPSIKIQTDFYKKKIKLIQTRLFNPPQQLYKKIFQQDKKSQDNIDCLFLLFGDKELKKISNIICNKNQRIDQYAIIIQTQQQINQKKELIFIKFQDQNQQ